MKQCTKCLITKALSDFYARRTAGKSGLDSRCKECRKQLTKECYSIERGRATKSKNRIAWLAFFDSVYGQNPKCAVCNKDLSWTCVGNKSGSVHWDHRHGIGGLSYSPSDWYPSRLCNDKNKQLWLEFDFGILCHNCNKCLPTEGREEWVNNINRYVFGENK